MKKKKKTLKAVDFFCGAGGMTYGMNQAGINVIAGIDIDKSCKDTYEYNNPKSIFIEADVKALTFDELSEKTSINKNDNNLIFIGCSPCQYYTNINTKRTKSKESRMLLEDFQRFVDYFNPGYIVVENVPGFEKRKGSPLQKFKKYLEENNYTISDDIVNALNYGVPQTRRRYLLLATRLRKKIHLPVPLEKTDHLILKNYIGIDNGFPEIKAGHTDNTEFIHSSAKLATINLKRMQATPKDGGTRTSWKNNEKLQLECYIKKDNTFSNVYGRMFWNHPAPTLTTKFRSISNGRFGHPNEDRGISLREGAVIQTFPKNYKFISKYPTSIARMIGNAVPPLLAEKIAASICCIT